MLMTREEEEKRRGVTVGGQRGGGVKGATHCHVSDVSAG